jgi:hypothetical protein
MTPTNNTSLLILNLHVVGVLMAALVVVNLFVPHRFHWRREMAHLSLLNRQIFQVHCIFILLILAMFAVLLLGYADALVEPTRLGRAVLAGLTIFWALRMLMQWFFYSPKVWRGNRSHTIMHVVFSVAWVYVTGTFVAALWCSY